MEQRAATATAPARPAPRFRWWWAGIGLAVLLGVGGLAWALGTMQPAPPPAVPPPVARTLTYQEDDLSIVTLDTATGITRTLLAHPPVYTLLLDLSPDGESYAYLQSTRPMTATLWNVPITYTVHLKAPGEAPRTVPIADARLRLENAWFVGDESLAVLGRATSRQLPSLYLYDAASGTSRVLASHVETTVPLPDQGMLLYTHVVSGDGGLVPFGIRTMELAALDVSRALTPQPVATWTLHEPGAALRAWSDQAQHAVFYTTFQEEGRAATGPNWDVLALNVLPVQPLGTPRPVATFTSDNLPPALTVSGSGRTLLWRPAVSPAARGTPDRLSGQVLAPLQVGSLRWSGGVATLDSVSVLPDRDAAFVLDSDRLVGADQPLRTGYGPPPTATRITGANPPPPGGRAPGVRPTLTPTPGGLPVRITDAGGRPQPPLYIDAQAVWVSPSAAGPYGVAQALGDRLLVVSQAAVGGAAAGPSQLWLAAPGGSVWQGQPLGAPPPPLRTLTLYGLTPDRQSLLLGARSERPDSATTLYRVRLDGSGGWTALATTAPASPIISQEE